MDKKEIIESLSSLGEGEIYLGVVGAVRTGKSTFIKKFIENLVVPNITDEDEKKRCLDEIPQSASGKTIMTVEPKFVPSSGTTIKVDEFNTKIKLIDCVGYVIEDAKGFTNEDGKARKVKTPWFSEDIDFIDAATIGTEKVIKDHSTIGMVLTTDGSFGDFNRNSYVGAEETVVSELKAIDKPFIIILNSATPNADNTLSLANELKEKYEVPVLPINVENLNEVEIMKILKTALYEFPIKEINVSIPDWVGVLNENHPIKKEYIEKMKECVTGFYKLKDVLDINRNFETSENIESAYISSVNTKTGEVMVTLESPEELYDKVLKEEMGISINSKADLLKLLQDYRTGKGEFDSISTALKEAKQTGYGIVTPSIEDMKLEKPEILKQGNRYGIKLNATASSVHLIKVDVNSSFEPIIGTESQCKELIDTLMQNEDIWKSEIFGRSLENIVKEGMNAKLNTMPDKTKQKLEEVTTKIVNKGSNNLIAIVL